MKTFMMGNVELQGDLTEKYDTHEVCLRNEKSPRNPEALLERALISINLNMHYGAFRSRATGREERLL